jgi:probable F420-dependent oxidoreductase
MEFVDGARYVGCECREEEPTMHVGLHALGIGTGATREVIDAVASAADRSGFATLWVGEHVISAQTSASRYPYSASGRIAVPPDAAWNDPMITLSFAAAASTTIRLATGILLLAEHNPVIVAKQTATLDQLSHGRLQLGVGIGWSREEFDALGIPFARRAQRTKEYIEAMRALWRNDIASFHGEFAHFDNVRVNPRPTNGDEIPIILGGNTDSALRLIASCGDGWYGFNLESAEAVRERMAFLRTCCREAGRDIGQLRCAVSLQDPQPADLATLHEIGIDELVLVDTPPGDFRLAGDWVEALASVWLI